MKPAFVTLLIISFLGVAVFGFSLTFLLIALSLVAFSILPRPLNNDEDDDAFATIRIYELSRMMRIIKKINFNNWLSLHINSPAFILAAA